MSQRISVLSTEYVRIPVTASKLGVPYDPTGDTVMMAFTLEGSGDGPTDFVTASWETAAGQFFALCLVGPAATQLPVGAYTAWVKITDSPEIPVLPSSSIVIY